EAVERGGRIVPRSPAFPEPGKGERRAVAARDEIRLFRRIALAPLVIAVGGNETAPLLRSAAKRRLLQKRLGPRVDERRPRFGVICPGLDQAPAQGGDAALAGRLAALPDNGHFQRRRDVVARREIRPLDETEDSRQFFERRFQ